MRKWLAGVGMCAVFTGAAADAIPEGIKAWMKPNKVRVMQLADGVLSIAFDVPLVSEELFRTQIKGLCQAPLVSNRYGWGNARIQRIELLNDIGAQGWALPGGRASCERLNSLGGTAADAYLTSQQRPIRAGRVQD